MTSIDTIVCKKQVIFRIRLASMNNNYYCNYNFYHFVNNKIEKIQIVHVNLKLTNIVFFIKVNTLPHIKNYYFRSIRFESVNELLCSTYYRVHFLTGS